MPINMPPSQADAPLGHPTPPQVFTVARNHATLLRHLFNHPHFHYVSPPTATIYRPDAKKTPPALLMVSDFVQTSYINHVVPLLPAGATRKCKDIANPWAWADPEYKWDLEWDEAAGELRDREGKAVAFPFLGEEEGKEMLSDMYLRAFMAQKLILENATDEKATLMVGGAPFDFGEDAKEVVKGLDKW
jgi:hypothetical protein